MLRIELDQGNGLYATAELELAVPALRKTLKVAISMAEAALTLSDRTLQTLNDLANMTPESGVRIRELLHADALRAKKESAFGRLTRPPEQPPQGLLRRLLWRPAKYRYVEVAPDDPRHPCYLPKGADSIDEKVTWLEVRIDENFEVEQRFALLDCRPEWEKEHGITIVIRNGIPVALADSQVSDLELAQYDENDGAGNSEDSYMDADSAVLARIRANAELVVTVAHNELGKDITYDQAGVEWLDGYIQRQHEQGDPTLRPKLVQTLGSFLGECIVRSLGGHWDRDGGTWAIRFDKRNAAFPFAKVQKHLDNGGGDSVLGFYQSIRVIFKTQLGRGPS